MHLGRNKEFDTVFVLHKAMEVFGQNGYEGTSLQDLLDHLGIARQSLYDTYGTKRDLFFSAVKHYVEEKTAVVISTLEKPGSPKEAISRIFRDVVEVFQDPERSKACFIINSAIEQISHDDKIAEFFHNNVLQLEQAFYEALVRAQDLGELKEHHQDLRSLARYLNHARLTLGFSAKLEANPAILQNITEVTLSVLD